MKYFLNKIKILNQISVKGKTQNEKQKLKIEGPTIKEKSYK